MLLKAIKSMLNKYFISILLLILIVIGGVFRFYNLSSQSYWMDEGYTVNAVLSIVEHGSTVLDSGERYSCPTYCPITAYFVKIFGNDSFSYRLLSVLAGLAFIPLMFLIIKNIFNRNIAILSSFFITFSYWQIAWSRQARWYTLFPLFFWSSIFFFYKSYYSERKRYLYILLTLIFTIFSVLTHGIGYLLPLIYTGWILYDQILIQKKFDWKKIVTVLTSGAVILWLFNLISNIDVLDYLFNRIELHYVLPYYLNFYLRNYWFFIILGVIVFFINKIQFKKEMTYLLFVFFAYFVPLSLFTNIVHYRYLFHLTPIFFIFGSICILYLNENIKSLYLKISFWALIIILFFTMAGGVLIPQTTYYLESDNPETIGLRPYYAYTPQPNWNLAYNFIKSEMDENDLIISSHPHFNKIFLNQAGYWIKYDYLGFDNEKMKSVDDKEFYVGAKIIDDLIELKEITANKNGYIILDFMSIDGKISKEITEYINSTFELVFNDKVNIYSEIWIWKF